MTASTKRLADCVSGLVVSDQDQLDLKPWRPWTSWDAYTKSTMSEPFYRAMRYICYTNQYPTFGGLIAYANEICEAHKRHVSARTFGARVPPWCSETLQTAFKVFLDDERTQGRILYYAVQCSEVLQMSTPGRIYKAEIHLSFPKETQTRGILITFQTDITGGWLKATHQFLGDKTA